MTDRRAILILAGGAGTRLWPMSTDDHPKQFLPIFGGESLLRKTFDRLVRVVPAERIWIGANERYRDLVLRDLPEIAPEHVLLEPARRNTGPAIAVCCAEIERALPGAAVGIFASDHYIASAELFAEAVRQAFAWAESHDVLMTIGIAPTEPATGYGYLEISESLSPEVMKVERFVEKPDADHAAEFVRSGRFLWNGSMFVWRNDYFFNVLHRVATAIAEGTDAYVRSAGSERARIYEAMPSISIDYAVMEKAEHVATVRGRFDWSDVGSWNAVARINGRSSLEAHVFTSNANEVLVRTTGRKPVAVVGLDRVAVIESDEGTLVINLDKSELLSDVVKRINGDRK